MKRVPKEQKGDGPPVSSQERTVNRRPADKPLVKRGSSASLDPPPVYIGCRLFVLLDMSSMYDALGVRGTVVSWADRSIGVPLCPAWPSPAPPWAAPTRLARGMSGFWIRQTHARHDRELGVHNPRFIRRTTATLRPCC